MSYLAFLIGLQNQIRIARLESGVQSEFISVQLDRPMVKSSTSMALLDVHTDNKLEPLLWSQEVPATFKGIILNGNRPHCLTGDFGTMLFQEVPFSQYAIWLSSYAMKSAGIFYGSAEVSALELHILLNNNIFYHLRPLKQMFVKETQFNITYSPFLDNKVKFESGQFVITLDVHFSLDFLKRMAVHFPGHINPFINRVQKDKSTTFFPHHMYATPQMLSSVHEIIRELKRPQINPFSLDLQIQLLFVQAISSQRDIISGSHQKLGKELDAVHRISTTILEDLSTIRKIEKLARVAGINRNKLKILFHAEYGSGIYEYWLRHRLEKGREMILDFPEMTIQDIAYTLGYSSAQSFEKAFKKMFHNSPSEFRRF